MGDEIIEWWFIGMLLGCIFSYNYIGMIGYIALPLTFITCLFGGFIGIFVDNKVETGSWNLFEQSIKAKKK